MTNLNYSRRRFLSALGTGAASLPMITLPGFVQAAGNVRPKGKTLILIELAGGNDGLNTVIPITDPRYRGDLRREIGLNAAQTLTLDADTGLHPSLRGMADLWEAGDMQIVEGVGYPDPNRSHFRSIEIWNAGLGAASKERRGWISASLSDTQLAQAADAGGLTLGGDMGPLAGGGRFSAMRDEDQFFDGLENLGDMQHPVRPASAASPLEHVLATYESAHITGEALRTKLETSAARAWDFPWTALGTQLRTAARLLDAGVDVPVLKVVQGGFDTHDAQPEEHAALLAELSAAIAAFARAMKEAGLWDQITIATYSEFGRTARENASGGTDHGTAAPVFVMGGEVRGGFSGRRPSLEALVDDDLVYTTDYRSLYQAMLHDLWQIEAPQFDIGAPRLQLLG